VNLDQFIKRLSREGEPFSPVMMGSGTTWVKVEER
jgi:hypothetical protein